MNNGRSTYVIISFQNTSKYYEKTRIMGKNMSRNSMKYKNE